MILRPLTTLAALWIAMITGGLAVFAPSPAAALLVTYRMVHQVTASSVAGVAVGDRLISRFVLDTDALDLDARPNVGAFDGSAGGNAPAWTTVNQSDPGVTILEVLAYSIEILAELQDQVADGALIQARDASGEPLFAMTLLFAGRTFASDRWPEDPPSARRALSESDFIIFVGGERIVAGPPLEITRVAEPGHAWLLALGFVVVVAFRRSVQGSASVAP